MFSCLFIVSLWSPAGNWLATWLSYMLCFIMFLSLSHAVPWVRCVTSWSLLPCLLLFTSVNLLCRLVVYTLVAYIVVHACINGLTVTFQVAVFFGWMPRTALASPITRQSASCGQNYLSLRFVNTCLFKLMAKKIIAFYVQKVHQSAFLFYWTLNCCRIYRYTLAIPWQYAMSSLNHPCFVKQRWFILGLMILE